MSDAPSKPQLDQTLDKLSTALERSRLSRRERRELRREERRDRKRRRRQTEASVAGGVVSIALALIIIGFVFLNPHLWWLVFPALGIGGRGARQLALASRKEGAADGEEQEEGTPKKLEAEKPHEIDALCDALLADLKESPEVVRTFLQNPEKTVEGLRAAAKEVDQRRKDLSSDSSKEQLAALEKQRVELKAKRDGASDPMAREKFDAAVRSLDGQEAALKQLGAVGERLDGEYTSLLVLLQELRTRVAVAKSTGGGSVQAGLEQSVQRLNAELEAITDSLHKAQGEGLLTPVDAGAAGSESARVVESGGRVAK
ncbi:MAG: hypothetical protein U0228_24875 [Myxococcaceae bacterium]